MHRGRATVLVGLAIAGATAGAGDARAGGLDLDVPLPRAIGRAGAVLVSEDGGAALLLNPGGLVRRGGTRARVAIGVHDDDVAFESPDAEATGSPVIASRGDPGGAPSFGLAHGVGPRVVLAVAYAQTGDRTIALPAPAFAQPEGEVVELFPHRYAGTAARYRRHTVAAGAAVRASDWLGVGVGLTLSTVTLAEERTLWVGFTGRMDVPGTPRGDLRAVARGRDRVVPGVTAGLLVAPPDVPLELATSVSYSIDADLEGTPVVSRARAEDFPLPLAADATATRTLTSPLTARAGLRYLGDRVYVEATGELIIYPGAAAAPSWTIDGIVIRDQSTLETELTELPSLVTQRDHIATRAAIDVEVVRGLLWLTAGYAFRTAATRRERLAPVHADLGGHTIAAGAEGYWNGVTFTVGYARTLTRRTHVEQTEVNIVNPFDAGSAPAARGRYDTAHDAFGAALEIAWE